MPELKETMIYRRKPFVTVFIIYLLCFAFRVWEYFALRTDQLFVGEAFIHKLVGIGILCVAVKIMSLDFKEIGFSKERAGWDLLNGILFGISVFSVALVLRLSFLFYRKISERCGSM